MRPIVGVSWPGTYIAIFYSLVVTGASAPAEECDGGPYVTVASPTIGSYMTSATSVSMTRHNVFRTENGGETWTELFSGLSITGLPPQLGNVIGSFGSWEYAAIGSDLAVWRSPALPNYMTVPLPTPSSARFWRGDKLTVEVEAFPIVSAPGCVSQGFGQGLVLATYAAQELTGRSLEHDFSNMAVTYGGDEYRTVGLREMAPIDSNIPEYFWVLLRKQPPAP